MKDATPLVSIEQPRTDTLVAKVDGFDNQEQQILHAKFSTLAGHGVSDIHLTSEEARLVRAYRAMNSEQRSFIYELVIDVAVEAGLIANSPVRRIPALTLVMGGAA